MILRSLAALLSAVCILGLCVVPAAADSHAYGNLMGTDVGEVDFINITESSDTDPVPLFGPPTRSGNRLFFTPTNFTSAAEDGASDTTAGIMSMSVVADEGYYLAQITIMEMGDYLLTGIGSEATFADVSATLTVDPGNMVAGMGFTPSPPFVLPDSGSYDGTVTIDLSGLNLTQIDLTFDNVLQTGSEAGTAASIQKNIGVLPSLDVTVIPEPGCLCLLAVGACLHLLRRKR
jgi:hypothetical protein